MTEPDDNSGRASDRVHERSLIALTEAARRAGVDVDVETLAPTRVELAGERLVPTSEYEAVVHEIFARGGDTIGLELARALPTESTGLWGFVLRTSPTPGELLRRAERFSRLFFRYSRLEVVWTAGSVEVHCDHPDPSPFGRPDQEVCFFLAQWLVWTRRLLDASVLPRAVRLRTVPAGARERWSAFFGVPITAPSLDDVLVLPRDVVDAPLPDVPGPRSAAWLSHLEPRSDYTRRICVLLAEGLLSGRDTETAIAERLGITERSLRRNLASHGQSFRELRQDVLQARAKELLAGGELPVREIAVLLGYGDATAFQRAFRGWTGLSPRAWCKRSG